MPSAHGKKGHPFLLLEFQGEPLPKKGRKGTTGQLGQPKMINTCRSRGSRSQGFARDGGGCGRRSRCGGPAAPGPPEPRPGDFLRECPGFRETRFGHLFLRILVLGWGFKGQQKSSQLLGFTIFRSQEGSNEWIPDKLLHT